jgi:glycosyltransferase involved in cell wall biosynthesis
MNAKILLFANTEWYLYNFRLPLVRALRAAGADIVLVSPDGPYGAMLRAEGFRWIPLPMTRRSLNPFREALLLVRLATLYRRERPVIAHHFTIKCVVYGSLVARLTGVQRRVNAVAGMGYVYMSKDLLARVLRLPLLQLMRLALGGNKARLIVQNSDDYSTFASGRMVGDSNIRLIRGSGVNTGRFSPRPTARSAAQPVRILFASRVLWDKGVKEFVEAAGILKARGIAARFLLAGEPDPGNPATVPPEVIDQWKSSGLVEVLGHVEKMELLLNDVDVAVLPSYREGAPRSLIEAAACGLPIVTTDVPGCREVVEHGITGLLVPCRDSEQLANAIQQLVESPEARREMGAAGRRKVLEEYDERIVLEKTMAVYRELVEDHSSNHA